MNKLQTCAFVVGTRPEAIKMAPIVLAMLARPLEFKPLLWLTGQHKELLSQTLEVFGIVSDSNFSLMQSNQSHADLVGKILQALDPLIEHHRPDWLLVQGDTSSALAGALAAFYAGIPVAHVEAGLRTYNLGAPFPEEGNRQMISRIASLHCTPTAQASKNLLAENISTERIVLTGNTVVDAIRWVVDQPSAVPVMPPNWNFNRRIVLVTLHRRESFGNILSGLLHAIRSLADDDILNLAFVFPVHPNPNVRDMVHQILGDHPRIALLLPLAYTALADVLSKAWLVITDSGGLQEEAPSLHKPVLVLRDVTERPEGVETGAAVLVGTDPNRLIALVNTLANNECVYLDMKNAKNPYGDGHAAEAILLAIQGANKRISC
jgi:UDP-N-acetylglucosamine 2-epimerase (non-hydrolysing)